MSLKRNLLAGWANAAVTALVGLAMVPVYLRYLGPEGYGLVGFFATLQSLLQVLDMGMAATLTREIARSGQQSESHPATPLVLALARVYAGIGAAIALVTALLAPWLALAWLKAATLAPSQVASALMLIGLALGLRWPGGLFQAVLTGGQRLYVFCTINIAVSLLTAAGSIALLTMAPDVRVLFGWQAATSLVLLVLLRRSAWHALRRTPQARADFAALRPLLRFSATVAGINVIGLWFMQFDKVLLSKLLPLSGYGHYMIASVITSALYLLITPIFNAAYPQLAAFNAAGQRDDLERLYRKLCALVAAVAFPLALWMMLWGEGIVALWTGDRALGIEIAPVIALLAAGSGLHCVMFVVYALQLAMGAARLTLRISVALLIVQAPAVWFLTTRFGGIGAAGAWLMLHVLYFVFGSWITHGRLAPRITVPWLLRDVGLPLLLATLTGLGLRFALRSDLHQGWADVLLGALLAGLVMLAGLLSSAALREQLKTTLRHLLRIAKTAQGRETP